MLRVQILRFGFSVLFFFLLTACQKEEATGEAKSQANSTTQTSRSSCILVAAWSERAPFHYRVTDGSAFGIDIDILSYLGKEVGCAVRYRRMDAEQGLAGLQSGDVDLLFGQYYNDDHESFAVYSEPYREESYDLHVLTGSPVHRDDLEMLIKLDFDLGLTEGYRYQEPISTLRNDLIHKSQFIVARDSATNIDNLLSERVDGILEDPNVVLAIADRELLQEKVERMDVSGGGEKVHLLFSRDDLDPSQVSRFNQAIEKMQAENVYEQILSRHT